ncbi:MAG: hypothetical protein R3D98_14370 [Candidatus Krumholzibacteriia bacterium]
MEHLRTRLQHLLLLLLDALEGQDEAAALTVADLRELLTGAGLDDRDLADLWRRFHDRELGGGGETWLAARQLGLASRRSLRLMGEREDELLTVQAFGYLIGLVNARQISAEQMESLIQYAQLAPDAPLGPQDLAPLLDRVVFADRAPVVRRTDRAH